MSECAEGASCSSCGSAGSCSAEEKQKHEEEQLQARLDHIKHHIVVMSGKGGVGKSTVAVNLAVALAQQGLKVGLLDADIHGPNLPKMLGLDHSRLQATEGGIVPMEVMPGLTVVSMAFLLEHADNPIVWRGPLKHTVIGQFVADVQWGELDYLVLDLPPGTGGPSQFGQVFYQPTAAGAAINIGRETGALVFFVAAVKPPEKRFLTHGTHTFFPPDGGGVVRGEKH